MADKVKLYTQHLSSWQQWRDAGNEPSNRDEAIKIVKRELVNVGIKLNPSLIRETLARDHNAEDVLTVAAPLSFMVWDLTQNNGIALDYRQDSNYFSGLFEQARKFITVYARANISVGIGEDKESVNIAGYLHVKGSGLQPVRTMSKIDLDAIVNRGIENALVEVKRWQALGVNVSKIKAALTRLHNRALSEIVEVESPKAA